MIEDAFNAILSDNSTNTSTVLSNYDVQLDGVLFNRNYNAISIINYTQTANNASPFSILNCVFTCRDFSISTGASLWPRASSIYTVSSPSNPAASPYTYFTAFNSVSLKAPYALQGTYGVNVWRSGVTTTPTFTNATYSKIVVGDPSCQSTNFFDNLMYGIYGFDANVSSFNNIFQNSTNHPFYPQMKGAGICVFNTDGGYIGNYNTCLNLETPISSTVSINKFYDCYYGIFTSNLYQLNVTNAKFYSTQSVTTPTPTTGPGQFGLYTISSRFNQYWIHNNDFVNLKTGIKLTTQDGLLNLPNTPAYGQFVNDVTIRKYPSDKVHLI